MSEDELLKDFPPIPRELRDRIRLAVRRAYEAGITDGQRDFLSVALRTDRRVERVIAEHAHRH